MLRALLAATLLVLLGMFADPVPQACAQERPPRPQEIASQAIAAHEAEDSATLERLARIDPPGAWSVADALLVLERADVALAMARASGDESADALVAVIESERDLPPDTAAREAVEAANTAFGRGDLEGALAALDGVEGRALAGLWVRNGRCMALRMLGRVEEAQTEYGALADASEALGWLHGAARATLRVSQVAESRGDLAGWRDAQRRLLAIQERRGDAAAIAAAAIDLGIAVARLGDTAGAIALYRKGIDHAREAGHRQFLANGLTNLGWHLSSHGDPEEAEAVLTEARALHEAVGNRRFAARAVGGLADLAARRGDLERAVALFREAATIQADVGDGPGRSSSLARLSRLLSRTGDLDGAIEAARESLVLAGGSTDPLARADAASALARVLTSAGRAREARETARTTLDRLPDDPSCRWRRTDLLLELSRAELELGVFLAAAERGREALAVADTLDDPLLGARCHTALGNALVRVGDTEQGLRFLGEALSTFRARGPSVEHAQALANVGFGHSVRGELAPAIESTLAARAMYTDLGEERMAAETLINVGATYMSIGDPKRAVAALATGVAELERTAGPSARAAAVINLGAAQMDSGDFDAAAESFASGRDLARQSDNRLWELNATVNLGVLAIRREVPEEAREQLTAARVMAEELRWPRELAELDALLASLDQEDGDLASALARAEAACATALGCGDPGTVASAHVSLASALVAAGRGEDAVAPLRVAAEASARMASGVPAATGGHTGGFFDSLQALSLEAADCGASLAEVFELVESARAGQLLQGLGGRAVLRESTVPAELARDEQERRTAVVVARAALDDALATGALKAIRSARAELETAEESYRETVVRVQLATRAAAAVFPRPASLEETRAGLAEGEVLVSFSMMEPTARAFVVTRETARLVGLGAPADLDLALAGLKEDEGLDAAALGRLRELLVVPLALPETCRHVVLAPHGSLSLAPFQALVGARSVAYTPSATARLLLSRDEAVRGEGVLALGDPSYGGAEDGPDRVSPQRGALAPLPGTREEAEAVGDVVLLGDEATEPALVAALAGKPRWRAVHLACHGLVDEETPLRSALAVTPGGGEDGFLSVLDVHRLRVPADLVVLSACDSGRGRVSSSEGVIGFTGAFLLSGADRVIVSLWKVDDQATSALMRQFYAVWKSGVPATEALRRAQEHVRSKEEWRHPRYWAAWQLWGRSD